MTSSSQIDIETLERQTLNLALNGMLWIDKDGRICHANDAASQILEYPYDDLTARTIFEIDPATSEQNLETEYLSIIRSNGQYRFEAQMVCFSGRLIQSDVTVFHVRHEEEDLYCTYFFDITSKKDQDNELRKTKYAIKHNVHSFFWTNSNARFSYVNDAACRSLGFTKDELYCRTVMDIVPDCTGQVWAGFWETLKTRRNLSFESSLKNKKGNVFPVEVNTDFFEIDGQEQCFACVRDITDKHRYKSEKKKLEDQLRQAQKLESLGTLAAGIAHDFNNILFGIFGYSQLIEKDIDKPDEIIKHASKVRMCAQRASELVQQILTFSRQTEYKKEPLFIYPVINETLKLIRSSIPANIEIRTRIESKKKILADPIRIHQVLMNLCTNAYHAMGTGGGLMTVSLTQTDILLPKNTKFQKMPEGTYLKLSVRDTGCGMDKSLLEKAFEPYFTTKQKGEGTGLGLAMVQAIVAEHTAFLDVDSMPGKGTDISIYFSLYNQPDDKEVPLEQHKNRFKGNETIMVVEDEAPIREIYKDFLERYGYTVRLFENGEDALKAFHTVRNQYDLVITDMDMPGISGRELAGEIVAVKKNIPIILSSGFNHDLKDSQEIFNGIKGYLLKPVPENQLLKMVRNLLDENNSQI